MLFRSTVFGESADGQQLPFKPVPLDAPTAPPTARSTLRSGVPQFTKFGGTDIIYEGWESTFDASGSSGAGLAYVIDFGDGAFASEPVAKYAPQTASPERRFRAIVIDRFGRVDTDTVTQSVFGFPGPDPYAIVTGTTFTDAGTWRGFFFARQTGSHVEGWYREVPGKSCSTVTGTLSGAIRFTSGSMMAQSISWAISCSRVRILFASGSVCAAAPPMALFRSSGYCRTFSYATAE